MTAIAPTKSAVTIERLDAGDRDQFRTTAETLVPHIRESAIAPINMEKAIAQGYAFATKGAVFVALEHDEIVGSLALMVNSFWYSDEEYLQNPWIYVRSDRRFGDVGIKLMRAARAEADKRDMICFIVVNTPDRRPKGTALSLYAQIAGYVPLGHVIKIRGKSHG